MSLSGESLVRCLDSLSPAWNSIHQEGLARLLFADFWEELHEWEMQAQPWKTGNEAGRYREAMFAARNASALGVARDWRALPMEQAAWIESWLGYAWDSVLHPGLYPATQTLMLFSHFVMLRAAKRAEVWEETETGSASLIDSLSEELGMPRENVARLLRAWEEAEAVYGEKD